MFIHLLTLSFFSLEIKLLILEQKTPVLFFYVHVYLSYPSWKTFLRGNTFFFSFLLLFIPHSSYFEIYFYLKFTNKKIEINLKYLKLLLIDYKRKKNKLLKMDTENLKQRKKPMTPEEEDEFLEKILAPREGEETDSDDELLPYGGRAYLARRKKPDTLPCILLQVFLVIGAIALIIYAVFYFEHMHVNVLTAYAHLGYDHAQHELANRYLHGVGVEKHEEHAMHWFKKAADQGHPAASYNLAIGHLKGIKTPINRSYSFFSFFILKHCDQYLIFLIFKRSVKGLIEHAANNEVHEAKLAWHNMCSAGGCD